MSKTLLQLASLQSRPDVGADTLARYEALPVTHHQMEEAMYNSGALALEEFVAWAASLDPTPDVIHIDLRSPSRNSYLGGKARSRELWRELRVPSLCFLHLLPTSATMDQLLNTMRTNPVGKTKDADVQVYPTTNLVHIPPHCDIPRYLYER